MLYRYFFTPLRYIWIIDDNKSNIKINDPSKVRREEIFAPKL